VVVDVVTAAEGCFPSNKAANTGVMVFALAVVGINAPDRI
jgi:hypothetical protein